VRRRLATGLLGIVLLSLLSCPSQGENGEYVLKAVFLERFTRFVDWPEAAAMHDKAEPFVIGHIGTSPLLQTLQDVYAEQRILGKEVRVRSIQRLEEIEGCHTLFVASTERERLPRILDAASGHPIITVGDSDGFAEAGVLFNFFVEQDRIRFEINHGALRAAGLSVSHLLLGVARVIHPTTEVQP